jgi:predicted transcriptional regulator of viral defense system
MCCKSIAFLMKWHFSLDIFLILWYIGSAEYSVRVKKMHNEYNNSKFPGGITKEKRRLLDLLNREQRGPFSISRAAEILGINYTRVSRLLAFWTSQGWLTRIQRGLYITVPLGTVDPSKRKEDAWIIAAKVFAPCYIGGWSACEHWGLTEQIFKDIMVFTSHKERKRKKQIHETVFILKVVKEDRLFGVNTVWRRQFRVNVSDPSRTIVDILNDPSIGGGIRNITDVLVNYFEWEHKNEEKLTAYINRIDNRAIYKRLGYIIEVMNLDQPRMIEICRSNISKGYSKLDPTVPAKGKILRRWNLLINVTLGKRQNDDRP